MKKFVTIFLFLLINSTLLSQIEVNISTDKQEYQIKDSIKIYVTATNITGQTITLNWSTTCQAGFEIYNVYKLAHDTSCYEMTTSITLDSAQSYTWSFSYYGIPAGHYQVFGEVYGYGSSDTTEIEIIERDFSYYSATIKNNNNQPIEDVIVTSIAVDRAFTNADGKFTLKYSSTMFPEGVSTIPAPIEYYHPDYGYYHDTISINKGDSIIGPDVILTNLISITGNIKFDNGDPAQNCYVYFFNSKKYYVASASDAIGNYTIQCVPGIYYIGASLVYRHGDAWTYRNKYYNDKTNLAEAEKVYVDAQTTGIDFTFPYLELGTISGKIIDNETQQPITNAWITIESVVPSDSTFSDTDENGNYTIEAFEGTYHVSVYVPGYYKQFYKDVYNTFDAIPITLDKDSLNIKGIDFSLVKPEPGTNTISGFVFDKNYSTPLYGVEVYAIPVNGGSWIEATTGFDGAYFLKELKNDNYIMLFYKENCISQFFKSYSETCDKWEDAFIFELNGGTHISNLYTYLEPMDSIGGQIAGYIYNNSNSSISGTLISAVDSAGNTVSSSVSVFNGSYLIPSLKDGNYTIKASKIGYQTSKYFNKVNMDLNSKPFIDGVDIYFTLTDAKKDKKLIPEFYKLSQNYPNPFNPSTTIQYEIPKESFVSIKVYNIIGREIATLVNEQKTAGYYQVQFDAANIPTGIYFCRINAGNYSAVNKMLLLK